MHWKSSGSWNVGSVPLGHVQFFLPPQLLSSEPQAWPFAAAGFAE